MAPGRRLMAAGDSWPLTRVLSERMRWRLGGCVIVGGLVAGVGCGLASAIVGGRSVTIASAPWTVSVLGPGGVRCTGAIIDAAHVVTAAHCLYTAAGVLASTTKLQVEAGVSNYLHPKTGDSEQNRLVAALRVHPGYSRKGFPASTWSPVLKRLSPDDIAVLRLSRPLDLSGPDAQAVALPATNLAFPAGRRVRVAGFGGQRFIVKAGRLTVAPPSGGLGEMNASVDAQGFCGNSIVDGSGQPFPLNGIQVCASAPKRATCYGDSGAALVTAGTHPVLIGIVDGSPFGPCRLNYPTMYTYVGAPEVRSFLMGDDHPPLAPRWAGSAFLFCNWTQPVHVGDVIRCASSGEGKVSLLTYIFLTSKGRVLQSGPTSTYKIGRAAVGSKVWCLAAATNAGGTTITGGFNEPLQATDVVRP
jgi:hypothetical protein